MAKRVSILVMSDAERRRALDLLGGPDAGEAIGAYVAGVAEDDVLAALQDSGLMVNVEPEPAAPPDGTLAAEELRERVGARLEAADEHYPMVLNLKAAHTPERQRWLDEREITLIRKLGPSSYLAEVPEARLGEVADRSDWFEIGPFGANATMESRLMAELSAPPAERGARLESAEDRTYDLRCRDPLSLPATAALIRAFDPEVQVQQGEDRLRFRVAAGSAAERDLLQRLANRPEVEVIEQFIEPELLLSFATAALFGRTAPPLPPLRWRGSGQVIGVADSGIDADHPDFAGRLDVVLCVPPMSARDPRGHGTHVASIAAGSGAASHGELAGVAPEAKLFVQSLADETGRLQAGIGIKPLLRQAYDEGVRVQNLSWGSPVDGLYTLDARDLDEFVYENPDMLVVIAAGNSGDQLDIDDGIGRNRLQSLASPATAKNCLSVGACCSPRTDGPYAGLKWRQYDGARPPQRVKMADLPLTGETDVVAALSSRGPSDDGRIKPDLVAPGVGIAAARAADHDPRHLYQPAPDFYHFSSGTSMAAPLVSGAAAIVRQYLIEARDHRPSAALLKAILINGAYWVPGEVWEDAEIGTPNFHQGFGRLDLARAIPLDDQAGFALRFADIGSESPQALQALDRLSATWSTTFAVAESRPLSVTMAWTDPPPRQLQHELDLVLVAPSGTRHVGNPGLRRLSFETFDRRNNVEQVRIAAPEIGEWEANVVAKNTYKGPQGFALAVTAVLA